MEPDENTTPPDTDQIDARRDREYRFGPFVFVPGWRAGEDDPWAHRRAEPRIFALLWAAYLMISALLTLFASRPSGQYALSHYEYGARALFLLAVLGAVVLAPMVRLSQARPARPARELIVDLLIVVLPIHAMTWPFPLLTLWTLETTAMLALVGTTWTALSFSIVAMALRGRVISRTGAMALILVCAGGAPLVHLAGRLLLGIDPHPMISMLSPFTAAYDLTLAPQGTTPRVSPLQVSLALAPLLPAGIAIVATARGGWGAHAPPRNRLQ